MSPVQRNRHAALLRASGYEDAPALTVQSTDGDIPHGRELSFAWLTGTVMTGLTSVLLMGAALYVSFQGQDTFSTAYEALQIVSPEAEVPEADSNAKTDRVRPVAKPRSELEIVEASIRETVNGRDMIRTQPFVRIRATLATGATALSEDVPAYDPVAILDANQPIRAAIGSELANPDIYGTEIGGEVSIKLAAMPMSLVPPRAISDRKAAEFVRLTVENTFSDGAVESELLAYAPQPGMLRELGVVTGAAAGVAENVTVVPKTTYAGDGTLGRTERILVVREAGPLADTLLKNGFTEQMVAMVGITLKNVLPSMNVPKGARLRILFGPSRSSETLIPYRVSIYFPDPETGDIEHAATAALTDRGTYVLGLAPTEIEFPEEDTEEINVANLPTVYRSIWETARKHDIDDATTRRIVAMFAYDVDMTKKISVGDSIEILQTAGEDGDRELLYVALELGATTREFFRFRTEDGTVDYYDAEGQTGKRFLTRRPVQGGGRLASRFGMRVHPIYRSRRMHAGVDLAAPTGTPIYASGDGVVEKAGWASGYGRKVEIRHVNGFETGYGHMSRIADGIKPGIPVRQGQIIGYVGSTGNSTGPHLHFEIKVNGRVVDPLSVKLPRDKTLAARYESEFTETVEQIRELMQREPSPMTVASLEDDVSPPS